MLLKELINKSWYGSIGYINNNSDIELLGSYLLYNQLILNEFEGHIFAFTYNELNKEYLENTISSLYPDAIIIYLDENRGHNFGTADLDNAVFDYCKSNNIEWLCKVSNDVILDLGLLKKNIEPADFYYINGVGFGGLQTYGFDIEKVIEEDFFPQTNFYFINVSKIDYLNDKKYLDETYDYINSLENYSGKVWDYIKDWTCEKFLAQCIERNNLTKFHLMSDINYRILLKYIFDNKVIDCSYKNIMVEGVCHYHFPQYPITLI